MSNSGPTVEIGGNIAIAERAREDGGLAREVEPGDRVGREGGEEDRDHGGDQRDPDRVDQRLQERPVEAVLEEQLVVVEGRLARDQRLAEVVAPVTVAGVFSEIEISQRTGTSA